MALCGARRIGKGNGYCARRILANLALCGARRIGEGNGYCARYAGGLELKRPVSGGGREGVAYNVVRYVSRLVCAERNRQVARRIVQHVVVFGTCGNVRKDYPRASRLGGSSHAVGSLRPGGHVAPVKFTVCSYVIGAVPDGISGALITKGGDRGTHVVIAVYGSSPERGVTA